jgi:uncharacterized protein (DUF488 family)
MKLKKVVTIGYEAADFDDFLATLDAIGVTTLLDIRELPISRRRGFAKTALREGLVGIGIEYRHEPRLGSPKAIRHQLRDDGDYTRFFQGFGRYLDTQLDLLKQLADELSGTVALLCYERDHTTCHRRAVATALSELTGLTPKHHGVQGHAQRQAAAHACTHLGQGLPAT